MSNFNGDAKYAEYDSFLIGPEYEKFRLLELGKYSGDAGKLSL